MGDVIGSELPLEKDFQPIGFSGRGSKTDVDERSLKT
jgi:hypothetical protein